jgi:hypothetical protein
MPDESDPRIRIAIDECLQRCLAVSWPRFELTAYVQNLEQDRSWSAEEIHTVEEVVARKLVQQGRA